MKHSPLKIAVLSVASTGLIITWLANYAPAWSKVSTGHGGFDAGESRNKLATAAPETHIRLVNAAPETRNRLQQIEQQRKQLHDQAMRIRAKEKDALKQLNKIENKLNATTGVLNEHKHELKKTESTMNDVQVRLTQTHTDEHDMSQQAGTRLREIYEGQRLSLVEMLFQVDSLQSFLDKWYYQERVAELDKQVLQELRLKAAALAQHKEKLGEKADKLGDIVTEFAKKAMAIAKEKFDQEQVASRLRTQRAFYEQAEQQLASESHQLESQILRMENSRHSNKPMTQGSGNLAYPISAQVTSPFGWRKHPIFGVRRFHTGVDLAGPNHSAIRAADSGNVLYTGWYGGYGKVVIVSHGKGMATLYAHMSKIATNAGDNVSKGDIVGYEGTTGFSTGPHLHFEVRYNGVPNNPLNYLH
jgi:murein DD-endopeptidase MepM/ murein hydrolase activator NlpD